MKRVPKATSRQGRRRGPRRDRGEPSGPEEVRRAVLDEAASLFAHRGLDRVSLRDIAASARVHPALIARYIGGRDDLVRAVFEDLSAQLASAVLTHPLSGQGFGPDTVMGKWTRLAGALAITGQPLLGPSQFNPVLAMARTLQDGYGLDPDAARLRAAQIVAMALGWRIFEDYLIDAGQLDTVPLAALREELVHSLRRLGATALPSPPDPMPGSP